MRISDWSSDVCSSDLRRFQQSDLAELGFLWLFVVADQHLLFANSLGQRHDFVLETTVFDRLLRASGRGNGERTLGFAAETVCSSAILDEGTHQTTFVVVVFEAVDDLPDRKSVV